MWQVPTTKSIASREGNRSSEWWALSHKLTLEQDMNYEEIEELQAIKNELNFD
jgi:hypothetical protein